MFMHPIIERNGGYEMATETIEVKIPKELLIGIEKEKLVEEIKKVIGTIAILLDAKDKGIIRAVKPLMDELMKKKIRISKELYDHALELADEEVP